MKKLLFILLISTVKVSVSADMGKTLTEVAAQYVANEGPRIAKLVAEGIPLAEATEFVKNSVGSMGNLSQLVSSGMPVSIASSILSKVPEAVPYLVKDPKTVGAVGLGIGATGLMAYKGYNLVTAYGAVNMIVDAQRKVVNMFVNPIEMQSIASNKNSDQIINEFEIVDPEDPRRPNSANIPISTLQMLALSEEISKDPNSYWRGELGKRMKEYEEFDAAEARRQGTE